MYDVLSIRDENVDDLFDINRKGSVHFPAAGHSSDGRWMERLNADGPAAVLDGVCEVLGYRVPKPLPPTERHVLTYRVITEFLRWQSVRTSHWEWQSGCCDTSGYGGGIQEKWFEALPSAQEAVRERRTDDPLGEPAYRFWFALCDGEPALAVDTDAMVHRSGSQPADLMEFYQHNRNLSALVVAKLLP